MVEEDERVTVAWVWEGGGGSDAEVVERGERAGEREALRLGRRERREEEEDTVDSGKVRSGRSVRTKVSLTPGQERGTHPISPSVHTCSPTLHQRLMPS